MHRKQVRLQDRQCLAGALEYQHNLESVCSSKYGTEEEMRRADVQDAEIIIYVVNVFSYEYDVLFAGLNV